MVSNLEKAIQPKATKTETQVEKKAMNFAASWYIAMQSRELGKKPKAIELFGQPLVAWRDQQGKPVIMERFCSHMGASLALGKVVDGCIQCPFHHWRFKSSGQCVHIPDVAAPKIDRIPSTARQAIYVTEERYGYIWVWYGSQTPLFSLPKFNAAESEKHNYMPYRFSCSLQTSVRRMIENIFDHHHVITTHELSATDPVELTLLNEQDLEDNELPIQKEAWFGSLIEARIKSFIGVSAIAKALKLNFETMSSRIDAWPSGFVGIAHFNGQQRYKVISSVTPISENKIILQVLLMINKTGNLWLDLLSYIVLGLANHILGLKDKPILDTISADTGRAFVKTDLPVLKFREFYQKWVDKAQ